MREVVIVSSVRTPVGRAVKGTLRATRPDELGAIAINRFCSSGLQAIAMAAERIMAGGAEVIVAGGTESMSMIPMGGNKISPNPWLVEHYPDSMISMGLTAERLATRFNITREAADDFSLRSHQKALAAIAAGRFDEETVPVPVSFTVGNGNGHGNTNAHVGTGALARPVRANSPHATLQRQELIFKMDEGPRADTSLEALASLKPAFHVKGTVTAGNASQMSDGAAAAVVMSAERAQALGIKPLARYLSFATAGYKPEEMGLGPVFAIPKALKLAGLKLSDIDVIELNEAFAAQALAVIQEGHLDHERVNVNGGAVALGHPLGCTGAKLTATIIRELKRRNGRYGLVTMCVGGGMGAAGIFENI